ncbi:MAG: MerR family transcriptional regulator [Prevotella sp.]|uniref:MerR family transcriptional regulator n=1 Tax=Prevotella sp. TaxID=59823 RepID=UPI002A297749|nr:MerR family transcriptional regulator [Prevotella sp.]MDD7317960.1 MerR family transcriptional regulator [Prevotellaceae bacterium]MDY4020420.1 MerR family transcriptional regulator [Prevotella sp.]
MPLKTEKPKKLYYSIKEVAEMFDVAESLLRYWETEFPQIRPKTTGNRVRQYTEKEIEQLRLIYNLVKVRGFKLAAARKMLHHNKKNVDSGTQALERLIRVRDDLRELKRQLDYLT